MTSRASPNLNEAAVGSRARGTEWGRWYPRGEGGGECIEGRGERARVALDGPGVAPEREGHRLWCLRVGQRS